MDNGRLIGQKYEVWWAENSQNVVQDEDEWELVVNGNALNMFEQKENPELFRTPGDDADGD